MFKEPEGFKYLTKQQLLDALKDVPDDAWLVPNRVGNLSVRNPENHVLGYLDFSGEGNYECD